MASVSGILHTVSGLGPDGEHLEPDPHERTVLAAIRDLHAKRCTLLGIAAELNARGWRTRRASAWRLSTWLVLCPAPDRDSLRLGDARTPVLQRLATCGNLTMAI